MRQLNAFHISCVAAFFLEETNAFCMLVLAFGWLMRFLFLWHLHLEHYNRSNHGIRQFLEVLLGI